MLDSDGFTVWNRSSGCVSNESTVPSVLVRRMSAYPVVYRADTLKVDTGMCFHCQRVSGLLVLFCAAMFASGCGVQPQPLAADTVVMAGQIAVTLLLQPNPPRAGQPATLTFTLREDGQPLAADRTTVALVTDMPKMPMSLPDVTLRNTGNGQWQGPYTFAMAGGWKATLRVTPAAGKGGEATFVFDVGP